MRVERHGKQLGGHNLQVVVEAEFWPRHDDKVALWLASGWCISFRNQFEMQPQVAVKIVESVADQLSAITAEANRATDAETKALMQRLRQTVFEATGPDYWR